MELSKAWAISSIAGSFFATLKNELVYQQKFNTMEEAKHAIFKYIEVFYNRTRVQSANDYYQQLTMKRIENLRNYLSEKVLTA